MQGLGNPLGFGPEDLRDLGAGEQAEVAQDRAQAVAALTLLFEALLQLIRPQANNLADELAEKRPFQFNRRSISHFLDSPFTVPSPPFRAAVSRTGPATRARLGFAKQAEAKPGARRTVVALSGDAE
jgi:hypothetical protein